MSYFLVTHKTIDAILTAANEYRSGSGLFLGRRTLQALGQHLVNLNHDAYAYRYKEKQDYLPYTYKQRAYKPVQAYKSICCLLYQCDEGGLDETELYQKLEELKSILAFAIVAGLAEYSKAQWDIG